MKKDKQYLINMYNGTSSSDESGEIESYESWLENQLLKRIEQVDDLRKRRESTGMLNALFARKVSDELTFSRTIELMTEARSELDEIYIDIPGPLHYLLPTVQQEINKQDEKWGEQNHPCRNVLLTYKLNSPDYYKEVCDERAQVGTVTWADIALEELSEAIYEEDIYKRKEEVIQLGAVCVQWAAKIERDILKLKTVKSR